MIPLGLGGPAAPQRVLALGAHPDDVEIGCGATLLQLARSVPGLRVDVVLLTATAERLTEARHAMRLFLPGADAELHPCGLPDGRLPAYWGSVKQALEGLSGLQPDLVLAPHPDDAHQDHRVAGEIAPTVWRDSLTLHYEIPKWDGDMRRPNTYLPLTEEQVREKILLLGKAFPSQATRDWWDEEVFLGLARLRGMECRARYAEAYHITKATLTW